MDQLLRLLIRTQKTAQYLLSRSRFGLRTVWNQTLAVWNLTSKSRKFLWTSIPTHLKYFLLLFFIGYALYKGLDQTAVIAPFELPPGSSTDTGLPFSGETVASEVRDSLAAIRNSARGEPYTPPCETPSGTGNHFGGRSQSTLTPNLDVVRNFSVQVRGVSLAAVVSLAREMLGREYLITGDVILEGHQQFSLRARANEQTGNQWKLDPRPMTLTGLESASCDLAVLVWRSFHAEVLAGAYIQRGDFEKAIATYRLLKPPLRDTPDIQNMMGIALRENHQLEDAIVASSRAIHDRREKFPEAFYNRGLAFIDQAKWKLAEADEREAIRLKPHYPEAFVALAFIQKNNKQYKDAIDSYRKAIGLEPQYPKAHFDLGAVLLVDCNIDPSISESKEATRLNPEYAQAFANLGEALLYKGQRADAITALQKALGIPSGLSDAERKEALNYLNRARDKDHQFRCPYKS